MTIPRNDMRQMMHKEYIPELDINSGDEIEVVEKYQSDVDYYTLKMHSILSGKRGTVLRDSTYHTDKVQCYRVMIDEATWEIPAIQLRKVI